MADEPTEHAEDDQVESAESAPAEQATGAVEQTSEQPAEVAEPVAEEISGTTAEAEPALAEEDHPAVAEHPVTDDPAAAEAPVAEQSAADEASEQPVVAEESAPHEAVSEEGSDVEPEEDEPTPRVKPSVPGAHLEVDIVPEGVDPLAPEQPADPYAIEEEEEPKSEEDAEAGQLSEPISSAAIDLAAGARYKATGKRKTAIARVILRPGSGTYLINGRPLDEHFPRVTLQRNIRQPLETVGYQDRMDVVARMHGGGISAQAGALRHGISRALLEADPNLRGELKRRGFLTRDSRAKERKKAGLKKARKRPQFSKR
jgi:small subunit ribosomal protein S9